MIPRKKKKVVREPIQVYLTEEERRLLDRLAKQHGISRAEVLRRGIKSFSVEQGSGESPVFDLLVELSGSEAPADLAERHDEYLAEEYEREAERPL